MKKVLVLTGGRSEEHEISLISAKGILDALDRSRFEPILVGVAKDGTWYLENEATYFTGEFRADTIALNCNAPKVGILPFRNATGRGQLLTPSGHIEFDVTFPILHGQFGEDGTLQGLFDLASLPYVGSRCGPSWVCMDKRLTKALCERNGIAVAPYVTLESTDQLKALSAEIDALGYPLFVKPSCQGSSIGISKVASPDGLVPAVKKALRYDRWCLIEKAIVGRELECAVLGLRDTPEASLPGEVLCSPEVGWYSYEAKYLGGNLARTIIPAEIPPGVVAQVQALAKRVFSLLECDGMARIDLLLEDKTGRLYLNEPNTLPGFTPISMYPKMWEASGLPYPKLISKLLDLAIERDQKDR